MRLTCPNCGAQYEVQDDVIPSAGRDVQCSNCGSTWFQDSAEALLAKDSDASAPQGDGQDAILPDDQAAEADPFEEVEPPDLGFGDQPSAPEEPAAPMTAEPEAENGEQAPDDASGNKPDDTPDELVNDVSEIPDDGLPDDVPDEERDNGGKDWNLEPETGWDTPATAAAHFSEDSDPEDEAASSPPKQPRGLDASIAEVLRKEAEHETRARAAEESQTLETQTELGLDAPDTEVSRRATQARTRMRRLRGQSDVPPSAAPAPPSRDSRRDLLPDIEEVNSTLRKSGEASRPSEQPPAVAPKVRQSRGFRIGFSVALLIALAVLFVYSSHVELAQSYPAAAPYIEQFVTGANGARVWLDSQITELFLWLDQIASGGAGS